MLEDSQSHLILTNTANVPLARRLTGQMSCKVDIINIDALDMQPTSTTNMEEEVPGDGDRLAYILYTSGSTGRPKGVMQTHRNVLYYTNQWIKHFSITSTDRITFITSFSHDQSVQDIFASLLSGACLYPYNLKAAPNTYELYSLLMGEKITIWHSVPSLFRVFTNNLTLKDHFFDMRWLLLGGEALRSHDLELFKAHFPKALLANIYGQTESSFNSSCIISPEKTFESVSLGETSDEVELLLVNNDGELIEDMGIGEIIVASDYIAPGYWGCQGNSERIFLQDEEIGRLYRTGDLGRLTSRDTIKMIGRMDFQVKIRGFRVETGEIETGLLQHPGVKEAVIVAKEDKNGDGYLCAYLVSHEPITSSRLRDYLSQELPYYMIPRYFIHLEQIPVTPNGKVDKKLLPEPDETMLTKAEYEPPGNEVEKKLAVMWQEILGVEIIGINDNFMDLGGHSLLVISIIAKIHQELNVELEIQNVFDNPTIRQLSRVITAAKQTIFSSIQPTEQKEYYPATSNQLRMYILDTVEGIKTTYNLPVIMKVEGKLDPRRFQESFQAMLKRHESLRTSFELKDEKLRQRVHQTVDPQMIYIDAPKENRQSEDEIQNIIKDFIKPFNLNEAPLIRLNLVKLSGDSHLLLMDIHHIAADGVSEIILMKEFVRLYSGEKLPGLKLQFRDYSEWQKQSFISGRLKSQEEYWLKTLEGELPILDMPTNYPRQAMQSFSGDVIVSDINRELTGKIKEVVLEAEATLYIVLLAIFNVLLSNYTEQEDIIIGMPAAGRNHLDLGNIVGMFVNTIPLRNRLCSDKSFRDFLGDVKNNALKSYENQDYPFEEIVDKLNIPRIEGRNPLFDVLFVSENIETPELFIEDLKFSPYKFEHRISHLDMVLFIIEANHTIKLVMEYSTALFKRSTIVEMLKHYVEIVEQITGNRNIKLEEIKVSCNLLVPRSNILKEDHDDFGF
jgi:amino acid adenylation domain-containing protein